MENETGTTRALVLDTSNEKATDYYNTPTSTTADLFYDVIKAGTDIDKLPGRKSKISHNTKYEVLTNPKDPNWKVITRKRENNKVIVTVPDITKLAGRKKTANKLFILTLIKANKQAIHNGQLALEEISFPLQELVKLGVYKTVRGARASFMTTLDILTSLKIKGTIKKSEKNNTSIPVIEVLFTGARIDNGQCIINLNKRINWEFLIQYYTVFPKYYFRLSNRASDLLYYICYIARQRLEDIKERGCFSISFRAIQSKLQLPDENETANPLRDIKNAIRDAVDEITAAEHTAHNGKEELFLLPVCDDTAPITDYLNDGYLQVTLKGAFASPFIEISEKTEKKKEARQKREDRIREKVLQKAIKKNLKQ